MNISTVAERSGVPPKTIRYYESIGLIMPAERERNGYRTYSAADMSTLNFVKRARDLGFTVDDVRELLDLWRNQRRRSATVKSLAARHLQTLDRKIDELHAMRKTIADLVQRCHGDDRPDCPILEDIGGSATPNVGNRARCRSRKP